MNYFLILVILAMGGGAYYEHYNDQLASAVDQRSLKETTQKLDSLQTDNKRMADEKAVLQDQLFNLQNKVAGLQSDLETTKQQLAQSSAVAAANAASPAPSAQGVSPSPLPPVDPSDLGNVVTLDGKSYEKCRVIRVSPDGVVVNCSSGITKLLFNLLPPDLQKRFGYDAANGPTLTPDQLNADNARLGAMALR